jgi:hypothetical protein
MPFEKRTAILVIHGVGPHTPFEVLDSFVRGFHEEFQKKNPSSVITAQHKLKKRKDWLGRGIDWAQNCVSLSVAGHKGFIDFYEYFWDIYMIHDVKLGEAFKLLIKASKNAKEFYKDHPSLLPKAMDIGEYVRKRKFGTGEVEFRPAGYLNLLGPFFRGLSNFLPYFPFLINILEWWASTQLPIISQLFKAVGMFIEKAAQDFIGDLVRYLDLDPRSAHFEIRQMIINGALDELRELVQGNSYDQIIIAGHSLGSVIAYDTLNRLIQDTNIGRMTEKEASKIIGLVTFGSPLDKIALFFREHVEEGKEIQRQILANQYTFHTFRTPRTRSLVEAKPRIDIGTPIEFDLSGTRWLNFYYPPDLVSGRLDLYNLKYPPPQNLKDDKGENLKDGNILIKGKFRGLGMAHSCYWGRHQHKGRGTNQMYKIIIEEFFP